MGSLGAPGAQVSVVNIDVVVSHRLIIVDGGLAGLGSRLPILSKRKAGVLVHLFSRVRLSVKMNMFGYNDDQLKQILLGLVQDPTVMVQVT